MVLQTFVCRRMLGSTDPSQERMRSKRAPHIRFVSLKLFLVSSWGGDSVNIRIAWMLSSWDFQNRE